MSKQNCTKFGEDVGQSSVLPISKISDMLHRFETIEGASKTTGVKNRDRGTFVIFCEN